VITIKKYANRRLYDTSRSTYVNLDDIAALIRGGHEVEVVDVKTGDDLTREVLLQIVLEVLKGAEFFPPGMLRRIIRASGESPADKLVRRQLVMGLDMLSAQLDRMESLMPTPKAPPPPPPPVPEPPPEAAGSSSEAADELDALRARLAALEGRLKRS
jgi:polyhydroxyalkanoate synthesis repressor PhaR